MARNPYANNTQSSSYTGATALDWAGGIGSGAAAGAGAGASFGPYGALIGGALGAATGGVGTAINNQKAKLAAEQQDALNRDLEAKDNLNRYMQQQGLADALGRQDTRLQARQAAARGNLTGAAAAQLDLQAQNQIALQQSQARPGMFLAAQQAELQRQQQVLNNYGMAQDLASAQQPVDMGAAFGALGQAGALYGTIKQGQKPVDSTGRNVSPDMMGQGQAALQADYAAEGAAAAQRQAAEQSWQNDMANPWGQSDNPWLPGYPAPATATPSPAPVGSPTIAPPPAPSVASATPAKRAPTPVSGPAIAPPTPAVPAPPAYPNMEAWNPNRVMSEPQPLVPVTIPGRSEPLNVRPEVVQAAEQKDAEALLQAPTFNDEPSYFSPPAKSSATVDVRPERIVPSNTSNGLTPYQYAQYSMWADNVKQNTSTYPSVDQYKRAVGL